MADGLAHKVKKKIAEGGLMYNTKIVYIGTYTEPILFGTGQVLEGKGKGIYAYSFDERDGSMNYLGMTEGIINPSYLAFSPDGKTLYAVNELKTWEGEATGTVSAYRIGPRPSELHFLNLRTTEGTDPCHLSLDRSGRHLAVANFRTGSIALYPLMADGSIGERRFFSQHSGSSVNTKRQAGPHAHAVIFDPSNRRLLVPDLGIDSVVVYDFDAITGNAVRNEIASISVASGQGPRSLEYHSSGNFAYLINELGSTVMTLRVTGGNPYMEVIQTVSTLPQDYIGTSTCADIHITSSGHYLYASNRGHDSLAIFSIDTTTGLLTCLGHTSTRGHTPRNFAIDPSGRFVLVANQDSDNIVVFEINPKDGSLKFTGTEIMVPTPVCIQFAP